MTGQTKFDDFISFMIIVLTVWKCIDIGIWIVDHLPFEIVWNGF